MSSSCRRPRKFLAFFLLLGFLSVGVYRLVKGPTIQADEVRVYRSITSRKNALPIVQLQGEAAQEAANNFNFSTGGIYYECLDANGWFRVVFSRNHREVQTFNVYLPNGQMNGNERDISETKHLSENSRRYWEQLVKGRH